MSNPPRPAFSRRAITRIVMPALLGLACTSTPAFADTVAAPAASTFRDSIGVQLHTDFQGFATQADTTEHVVSALTTLGIDHVRDGVCMDKPAVCALATDRLSGVTSPAGANADLILSVMPNVSAPTARADRDAEIEAELRRLLDAPYLSRVKGLEMVNEPDLLKTGDWAAQTVADAKTLHRLLAEPDFAPLSHIPLLAPALGRQTYTDALLKAGWTSDLADIPNMHPYPPTYTIPETALDSNCDPTAKATAPVTTTIFQCAKSLASDPSDPIASESGYSTAGTVLVGEDASDG